VWVQKESRQAEKAGHLYLSWDNNVTEMAGHQGNIFTTS
jgi:hypothetical protein